MHSPGRVTPSARRRPIDAAVSAVTRMPSTRHGLWWLAIAGALTWAMPARAATVSWLNPVSGNWSDGTKWSGGLAPAVSDSADISVAGTYTVTLDVNPGAQSIGLGGASGRQTLSAAGRTIAAPGGVFLRGNGELRLVNASTVSGPVHNAGTVVVQGVGQTSWRCYDLI
jgi:fibronectin-binding autotransporter adhesin